MATSRFTDEQIIGIVREYEAGGKLTELCRRHNISPTTFYKWRPMQFTELRPQHLPSREHRFGNPLQHRVTGDQHPNAAANGPLLTSPTLSSKPRSSPRKLSSTSRILACSCLRATSSARTSWASGDLACTGRNQPIRRSWAMPRACDHRRECRLHVARLQKHRIEARPDKVASGHRESGPASRPMRISGRARLVRKPTSASGSLATFASRTIRPAASLTQTLLCSSETSTPA